MPNYIYYLIPGTQGVGKSMIMNLIGANAHDQSVCSQILSSHEMPQENTFDSSEMGPLENQMENLDFRETPEVKGTEKTDNIFKFKMQDIEQIERGVHCTKGNRNVCLIVIRVTIKLLLPHWLI